MRLTDLLPDESVRVVSIKGGRCLCQHLALRGLAGGCLITLSGRFGPVVVRIDGGIARSRPENGAENSGREGVVP
ncbi:MAG: ferrous iron transport protein A [Candidatus Methanoculleus thermohydrogenotrophicum]